MNGWKDHGTISPCTPIESHFTLQLYPIIQRSWPIPFYEGPVMKFILVDGNKLLRLVPIRI